MTGYSQTEETFGEVTNTVCPVGLNTKCNKQRHRIQLKCVLKNSCISMGNTVFRSEVTFERYICPVYASH